MWCMCEYVCMSEWTRYEQGHKQAEVRHNWECTRWGWHLTSRRAFWTAQYQAWLTREASFWSDRGRKLRIYVSICRKKTGHWGLLELGALGIFSSRLHSRSHRTGTLASSWILSFTESSLPLFSLWVSFHCEQTFSEPCLDTGLYWLIKIKLPAQFGEKSLGSKTR